MILALIKWGFALGLIVALVFGLSSKRVQIPMLNFLRKYLFQIILVAVIYTAIIIYALIGT